MEYGFLSRAGKFLQEQKKHRRWMVIFLCLATGVTLGTLGFLKLYGQAMTHQVKVLDCKYEVHVHTDECYTEDEDGNDVLICEHADEAEYVVHVHNDDCYDNRGDLVCPLEEHEAHEHTDDCWEEREVLVCGLEETETVQETVTTVPEEQPAQEAEAPEEQPAEQVSVLVCQLPEHVHDESCEPEACQIEEHTHSSECQSDGCGLDEHEHTEECYDENGELVCTKEEHTHDESCEAKVCEQEEHTHSSECQPEGYVCGMEEHTHDESCYEQQSAEPVQPAAEEPAQPVTEAPAVTVITTEGHVHTDECYETEWVLTCGELELHTHEKDPNSGNCCYSEDCYDEDGNFIEGSRPSCGLLQLEEHIHTEDEENPENSCFDILELTNEEVAALNGGATLHVHTDECYDEEGNLICGHEVTHLHQLDCYDEDGNLICGFGGDSHEHDAKCYDEEGNLTCGFENAKDHEHDAGCYDEEGNLTCGYEGVKDHEHRADCYDEEGNLICGYEGAKDHEHDAGCYDEDGILICGFDDAKVHEHDAGCYDEEGNLICGYEGAEDHQHVADCYDIFGNLICGYEGVSDHVHTEECYDEEGNLICGKEVLEIYEQSKAYECDSYIVVARYNNDAEIPEEAEFLAEQITADSDQEHYASRETEYRNELRDETASMRALLKIGFYMDEEDERVEVEPKTPVAVAVQFLDEDGLLEGKPITIIHFAEEGLERLDGSKAKNNSTSFKMNSFSEIAIGYEPEKKIEIKENGSIHIADDFTCEADPFRIVFHVEGDARTVDGTPIRFEVPVTGGEGDESGSLPEESADGEAEETAQPEDGTAPADTEKESSDGEAETAGDGAEAQAAADGTADPFVPTEEMLAQKLKFHVQSLDQDPEIRKALTSYIGESTETVSRNILHTFSYGMTYDEAELDLSGCSVTAQVTLGEVSPEAAAEAGGETAAGTDNLAGEGSGEAAETDSSAEEGDDASADAPEAAPAEAAGDEAGSGEETPAASEGTEAAAQGAQTAATPAAPELTVVNTSEESAKAVQALKSTLADKEAAADTEISVTAVSVSESGQVQKLGGIELKDGVQTGTMSFAMNSRVMAVADTSTANPTFTVQYYAYAQIMATENPGGSGTKTIKIIDTVQEGKDGVLDGAQLPDNNGLPRTRDMYVTPAKEGPYTADWKVYDPVYISKDSIDSLTKIYTADLYEFREASGGLEHINKFAKAGLNYDLFEVWVTEDKTKTDSVTKDGWTVYSGDDIQKLVFRNNDKTEPGKISVHITKDTIIRLVGRSNDEKNKSYPARFFDYDITNGSIEKGDARYLKGINNPLNYKNEAGKSKYGFGNNNSGDTGLRNDTLPGGSNYINYINRAKTKPEKDPNTKTDSVDTILEKCFYGLVEPELSSTGYPVIKADAPDLFNPQNKDVKGRTEISGRSLNFNRDGDTYTLTSVTGSGAYAQNLNQFQLYSDNAWGTQAGNPVFTNQFWPMDNAATWGDTANGHDPKFGTEDIYKKYGLIVSDDGQLHNSFFGMVFEVDFRLTDDYVGPLNYYFFGDDDMWVFLEYPDGSTRLVCDIGGVHQAAGEYVDLWNYIEKPEDTPELTNPDQVNEENRNNPKYKLKFFYTERGASGSTCWMQFTLPSVNAVPVIDYTGNVRSTLTLGKTVNGEPTTERFEFTIEFSGDASNIASNDYPYVITNADKTEAESGDIASGGTFKLGHGQTIEVFNLPDNTKYIIKEKKYAGYIPELGSSPEGTIIRDQTVEGNINWKRDDIVGYINQELEYNLPETGGPGPIWYMIAGAFFIILGAGLMCNKKFSERRV